MPCTGRRRASIGYHRRVNLPGLLLRWMLLVALVLNAPGLARAAASDTAPMGSVPCAAPHDTCIGLPACCEGAATTSCQNGSCECPPASLGLLAALRGPSASPWCESPVPRDAARHASALLPDPLRPPIG